MLLKELKPVSLYSRDLLSRDCTRSILILHGMLGSSQNWTSLGRIIHQKTGSNVYLLDARNHGKSPHQKEMTYRHMAAGHSMGARTAMTLSLMEPELVSRLVSVDASPTQSTTSAGIHQMNAILKALRLTDIQKRYEENKNNFSVVKALIDKDLQNYGISKSSMRQWILLNLTLSDNQLAWSFHRQFLEDAFESHLTIVPQDLLTRKYNKPTLFIGGENSGYISRESHQDILKTFPEAEFVYVKNAGHWVHADNPREFLRVLLHFLNSYNCDQY